MRQLKFRQWYKGNFYYWGWQVDPIIETGWKSPINIKAHNITPDMSEQFTGLLDKHDNEIWEGDIIKYDVKLWEIRWRNGSFIALSIERYPLTEYVGHINNKKSAVVGNIRENPELLRGRLEDDQRHEILNAYLKHAEKLNF